MPTTVTHFTAERHEALYLRLQALVKHTEASALRRPAARVPEATRVLAEGLLFDARPFLSRHPHGALPAAAPDYGGLAAQLGQALAGLQAFEARHAYWDGNLGCFVWSAAGEALPVRRLRPEVATRPAPEQSRSTDMMRKELARRIAIRFEEGYRDGVRAAAEGRPMPGGE